MDSNNDTTITPAKPDFDKFINLVTNDLWDNCPTIAYQLHEHMDSQWWTSECRASATMLTERLHIFRDALRRLSWIISDIKADANNRNK